MPRYIHGETDPAEVARLETQARFLSRWILDGVEVGPSARLLDLACGTGAMSRRLRARFPDAKLVGSDLSLDQLRAARDEQIRLRDPIPLVQSTAAALPFADRTFDAVHASWFLEHVAGHDVVPILREHRRGVLAGRGAADHLAHARGLAGWIPARRPARIRRDPAQRAGFAPRAAARPGGRGHRAAGLDRARPGRLLHVHHVPRSRPPLKPALRDRSPSTAAARLTRRCDF